jgi:hypothetical protein
MIYDYITTSYESIQTQDKGLVPTHMNLAPLARRQFLCQTASPRYSSVNSQPAILPLVLFNGHETAQTRDTLYLIFMESTSLYSFILHPITIIIIIIHE